MNFQFIAPKEKTESPKFVKTFELNQVKKSTLYITGLGLYRAFLNGKRIGCDYLTPGCNDYNAYLRYQTYDVTDLLHEGSNSLCVLLGNGWYKGRFTLQDNVVNVFGDQYLLGAELTEEDENGKSVLLKTDETWMCSPSFIKFNNIYDGEIQDMTADCNTIIPCAVISTNYNVIADFTPTIRIRAELKPELIITSKNEQVLDFKQNFAGIFRFICRAPKNTKVYIQTGEVLQDGCFYRDNLRTAKSEFTYISDGNEHIVEPMFTFYGYRYMKVEGIQINPEDFIGLALCSDLKETLRVHTGNEKINRLLLNALWGQRSNFIDVPTDCPQRDERLGWTADTQVFVQTACYHMYCKDFYSKFLRDMRYDQITYLNGDLPCFTPCFKDKGPGGAVWADAGTIIPMLLYRNYADVDLLRQHYPMMRDYVEVLIQEDQALGGSHVKFDKHAFGDWLAIDVAEDLQYEGGKTNKAFIQAVYYYLSVKLTYDASVIIGEKNEKYAALAEEIKQAIIQTYIAQDGTLLETTQTAYILSLKHGLYTDKEIIKKALRDRLETDGRAIKAGFCGAPLMLPVLFENGMEDIAYDILFNEKDLGWLYCVNLGATTIWERWNSLDSDGRITGTSMNSLNHYAYGSVAESIYAYCCGLRCGAPGWTKAILEPHFDARLGKTDLTYESPAGVWKTAWEMNNNKIRFSCTVPAGCTARLSLKNIQRDLTPGEYCFDVDA